MWRVDEKPWIAFSVRHERKDRNERERSTARACGSDWLFVPAATAVPNQSVVPPALATGSCIMGSLTYGPLAADAAGQSFTAILLGDVTANWQ